MIIGIIFGILILYSLLIVSLLYGFLNTPTVQLKFSKPETNFSVIIPFRDEAQHLPIVLSSIAQLHYPNEKVSFWFVDDESEDESVEIIENFCEENPAIQITILKNKRISGSPKKDAISTAISQLQSDWIITTDADCVLPPYWLDCFNEEIVLKQPKMIAAPVTYKVEKSFFSYFQLLDFLSLQGTTIGSFGLQIPFMCNGANLAYQKKAFLKVRGFSGNDTIASGDDVFLLEKFVQKWSKKVLYLKSKEVLVKTFPVETYQQLISQRVRWASKSANYSLLSGKLIGMVVILMNFACCIAPFLLLWTTISWQLVLFLWFTKVFVDSILLFQTLQFTQQKFRFFYVIFSGIVYPFFTIFICIKSFSSTYIWKERVFKK